MNSLFHERKSTFFLLLILGFLLLFVVYYISLHPLIDEVKQKQVAVKFTQNEIDVLLAKSEKVLESDQDVEELLVLQEKVPMSRELARLILTLERIEAVSNSQFDDIRFAYDGLMPQPIQQSIENESTGNVENKPAQLEGITVQFRVTSPSYEDYRKLLKEFENETRIMAVSQIDFEQSSESTIVSNVTITTFYFSE